MNPFHTIDGGSSLSVELPDFTVYTSVLFFHPLLLEIMWVASIVAGQWTRGRIPKTLLKWLSKDFQQRSPDGPILK